MASISSEEKTALKLLNSIDISLGRIATALEKQNDNRWSFGAKTTDGGIKNDDSNKGSTVHVVSNSGESEGVSRG